VAQEVLVIKALNEKRMPHLPAGPLVWRLETFPTLAAAQAAEGPLGLVAESTGQIWLVTLGPAGGASPGGTRVAEIGPVPIAPAANYLLRINESSGAPDSVTPVHSHPGSEAFYVLAGEQSLRTATGEIRTGAGAMEIGPAGGTPLQVASTGTTDLRALIMFAVDADHPFSSPATFEPSFRRQELALGRLSYHEAVGGPALVAVQQFTFDPGARAGWHTHPGPALITVSKGEMTFYDAHGCRTVYPAGSAVLEQPYQVHEPRNETAEPLEFYVTFIVPVGPALRSPAEAPTAECGG
jgi:quercetin dioxygenase-like cupin family protein